MSFYGENEGRLRYVLPFEATPMGMRLLREAVRCALDLWGAGALVDDAALAVTELATNVITHVGEGTAAILVLEPKDDLLRIEVHDTSHSVPAPSAECPEPERGNGLRLVAAMSQEWGTLLTAMGKAVWCELSLEPVRHHMRVQRAAIILDEYRRVAGISSVTVPTFAVLEESVTDVITDLLHWLAAQGGDPDELLDRAQMHFEAEDEAA
ncbi:ATP-binding protein [Streptomyces sp. NPDC058067]|uniref:ATP-binding protein n=1 Tax=Streptomyces sp. NPDC058067 TaxID=3346324 RepID=UPI0036EB7364